MHFIKTVISLFALASLTSAQHANTNADLDARDTKEYLNYVAARDNFIVARDLYRRGSSYKCVYSHIFSSYQCSLNGVTEKCPCSKAQAGKKCKC
ncbi:unnamed protein product [Clonostachys solani]|uniref:Uncharacterized protein n=1 Tax=Clonostachys solani TaxID=160281 RepID=A0A9N9YVU5_9HYPO|nr:unnamed protein product [Clonostachys solani]